MNIQEVGVLAFLGVVLGGLLMVLVIYTQQQSTTEEENYVAPLLAEESVIAVKEKSIGRTATVQRKEGYSLEEKPFAENDYEYDERTKDFRLVCTRPCPVSKQILDQEFAAITYGVSTLRGLTQSDIDKSLMPFEVHASEDEVCPILKGATAYMNWLKDKNGYTRGGLCFFFDKISYNREKFPYSTSVHEITHLFEDRKVPYGPGNLDKHSVLWEGLSMVMMSFFIKGNERNSFCWEGNNWYGEEQYSNPHDAHGTGRELFFSLCNQYGFDYDDLPRLFQELDKKRGDITVREFITIINNIVGADTTHLFTKAGVI